ncbi:MAG: transposase [Ignavibacteria bacterium]|nr:transposase [Ignavibacteria bacterium]
MTSYSGYDIIHDESGTHKGKTKISKKVTHKSEVLYMPALTAIRCNKELKQVYIRLCKTKINKKIAIIAVARKLLILIYCLWKKNEKYNDNYRNLKAA